MVKGAEAGGAGAFNLVTSTGVALQPAAAAAAGAAEEAAQSPAALPASVPASGKQTAASPWSFRSRIDPDCLHCGGGGMVKGEECWGCFDRFV